MVGTAHDGLCKGETQCLAPLPTLRDLNKAQ
jgi:hypothetical protein